MTNTEMWDIAFDAVKLLTSRTKLKFTAISAKEFTNYSFIIKIRDEEMADRMKKANCIFLDYIPEFEVEIGKSYFKDIHLLPFDNAVGISTDSKLPVEKRALVRCAYRIQYVNKDWRDGIFRNHPELK